MKQYRIYWHVRRPDGDGHGHTYKSYTYQEAGKLLDAMNKVNSGEVRANRARHWMEAI